MTAQFIYTMKKVSRFYPPDREVLKDISLSFFPGAKIGVLGNNGSGKSSLLSIMAGQDSDHDGEARLTDGFTVGLLEQEPALNLEKNVLGNVMEGVGEIASLLSRYDDILASWSDPEADFEKLGEQQAEVERLIESAGAWDLQRNIEIAMDALRLPDGESDVNVLSGGERRRVALCKLLLSKPDLLLLDEPTNHLDAESVSWLERTLQDYSGTVVAVTHDRYFLDNVAGWILELDRGRGIPYEGNYSGWLDQKSTRLEAEEKSDSSRKRTLERELEWIRMAPKARQAKGKARLASYDKLIAEANETEKRDAELQIQIPANSRLGDQVIEVENLNKGFEDRLLIEDLSFTLPPAGIVGIVGGNGAGKTTLFKMLVAAFQKAESGDDLPDSGVIKIGSTVELGYVDQSRDSLDPDRTVYQEITDDKEFISVGNREVNGRAYVASFNFRGSDQQKKVGDLSGGERNRVHLAKVLKTGSNVLLLDEPTNDLDVDTLRALESGLEAFPGCAVIISHDRWFLDRVATHVLSFEGNSYVRWFEGNFSEYEEVKRKESGGENVPTRMQYKPLSRN
ncbi:MAG: energy-dependent translational throttle protein EttA [Acidimicrobiales bacterium]|nr:energy-dependent translational throttle protein EttA [Acidimicrobiaceae bacterium]MDP6162566.1 energy-dependent translational throttle protein EttA [Acidimicrobiales bacterium]MDP6285555.1 energy-dependent translational throttle protein EttA [Acidimicrobiales bacterium]HJL91749.1 energy-dependent translational throttle protein EttA [Acidimicrobiales bacterium]HJO40987.1 energy-dependent translational throttle protein EttA [Acidimicrobiales bacterium]